MAFHAPFCGEGANLYSGQASHVTLPAFTHVFFFFFGSKTANHIVQELILIVPNNPYNSSYSREYNRCARMEKIKVCSTYLDI